MKPFAPLAVAFLAMLVVIAPAVSQESEPVEECGPESLIRITPKPGGWELQELFRTISAYTDESIVYDPKSPLIADVRVEFTGTQTVPRERLFAWFQALLSFNRIVLVPMMGDQWMALDLNAPQVKHHPIFVPEDQIAAWDDRSGVFLVTSVRLSSPADAERAMGALASLVTPDVGRIHHPQNQPVLVLSDFAPRVAAMVRTVHALEKRSEVSYRETQRYEALLAASVTESAAKYFIERIKESR